MSEGPEKEKESDPAGLERQWFFFPSTSFSCSLEFALFVKDYHSCVEYFSYLGNLAYRADEVRRIARGALAEFKNGAPEKGSDTFATDKYIRFGGVAVKHITNVTVDAFLWYISNIVQRILLKRPEMLKTKEQVRVDEIVDFSSKRELVKFLVDRRISRPAYGGLSEIEAYLTDTLGLDLFDTSEARRWVRFFVEVRNVNAHNRGRANSIFLARTAEFRPVECVDGQRVVLALKVFDLCEAVVRTAMGFDQACCNKFKLRRLSMSSHIKDESVVREINSHHFLHLRAAMSAYPNGTNTQ